MDRTKREIKAREFTEYRVAWLICPKCGLKLDLMHRETPHRRQASHRLEVKIDQREAEKDEASDS